LKNLRKSCFFLFIGEGHFMFKILFIKKISLIFIILLTLLSFPISIYSQTGWFQQSPLPTSDALVSIKFVNSSTGFIAGGMGTILKSTNYGQSWLIKNNGANNLIKSMDFFDENTGLVIAQIYPGFLLSTILKTSNNGENWTQIISPINLRVWSLNCTHYSTAYITCDSGFLYKTTNNGFNWYLIQTGFNKNLINACFIDNYTGYVLGYPALLIKTTNGGNTWSQLPWQSPPANMSSLYFINENTGFIGGGTFFSIIQNTTDSGNSWNLQTYEGRGVTSIKFSNPNDGMAVGVSGTILKTVDGGNSWVFEYSNILESISDISMIDKDTVYAIGGQGSINKSLNGGINWFSQFSGSVADLNSIYFSSTNTGYAIGQGFDAMGRRDLIKTTNMGINWLYLNLPLSDTWQKIQFVNNDSGFVLGGNGNILKTLNGGVNWINLGIQNESLFGLNFLDFNTGFVAGFKIFKTTNNCISWELENSINSRLFDIRFIKPNTGYTAGENGIILKSTDSGLNWVFQNSGTNQDINSIYFLDKDSGFICGGNFCGFISKTSNGGSNWFKVFNDSIRCPNLKSIYFVNTNTGYCVGSYSLMSNNVNYLIKTTNNGYNWFLLDVGSYNGLNSIYFLNDSLGYVCGINGTIFKTTNGGDPIGLRRITTDCVYEFNLLQNFPNPFNTETTIKYNLPKNSHVNLIIYDVLGRKVLDLVNENQLAGYYDVKWNGLNFGSGIYFYKLITNIFSKTKKMILLK